MAESQSQVPAVLTPAQLVHKQKTKTVKDLVQKMEKSLTAVLPKHIKVEALAKAVMVACQKTPKLLDCTPQSFMRAMMLSAETGLLPGGAMNHAHLIPFKNRKTNKLEVVWVPGYQGLIALARNTGDIESIAAHVVHKNDVFEVDYGTETLTHKPNFDDPGPIRLVYASAKMAGSPARQFEVLSLKDISRIKASSQTAGFEDSPWKKHEEPMMRKTAIKQLAKYLPLSPEKATRFKDAIAKDDQFEAGEIDVPMEMGEDDSPEESGEGMSSIESTTGRLAKELTTGEDQPEA